MYLAALNLAGSFIRIPQDRTTSDVFSSMVGPAVVNTPSITGKYFVIGFGRKKASSSLPALARSGRPA